MMIVDELNFSDQGKTSTYELIIHKVFINFINLLSFKKKKNNHVYEMKNSIIN